MDNWGNSQYILLQLWPLLCIAGFLLAMSAVAESDNTITLSIATNTEYIFTNCTPMPTKQYGVLLSAHPLHGAKHSEAEQLPPS